MFEMTFTDAQGVTHTNAVVRVRHAHVSNNQQTAYQVSPDDTYSTTDHGGNYVSFSVEYWANATKRTEGRQPYRLFDLNLTDTFNINLSEAPYEGLAVIAACEHYLANTLLPSLSQS